MQRYRWPGYEMQLLGELQRQQNSAQFCDTLLQTEGISVPTHSCVLAALSPYLSQRLSASPSPPYGQKHQLQLQTVKAQTLLKLVRLLYSGELEVKGNTEWNDVLAAAHQFGIANLVEGQKDKGVKEAELQEERQSQWSCREKGFHAEESRRRDASRKLQDAQVQTGRMDMDSPVEKISCISTGTQTVEAIVKSVSSSVTFSSHDTPSTPESTPSVAQSLDFSVMLQTQSKTPDQPFCSSSCPLIPSMPSGASSEGESTLNRSSGSFINPTSSSSTPVLSSDMSILPISLDEGSESPRAQEQSSEFGNNTQVLAEERTELKNRKRNGKMTDIRGDRKQLRQANGDDMPGKERGRSTEKRHAHGSVGKKSLAKMKQLQQMMETTQISIKVKLRRRTKGEMWEVVSLQDTDETLSVCASLKQDGSNLKRPESDLSNAPTSPSTVYPRPIQRPDCLNYRPATTNDSPLYPNISSESQPLSTDGFTPNQNNSLESAPVLQHQGSVEESDEQIEKLLEDIMMGLNILPNLEKDSKKSHYVQPSHDVATTVSQVPVPQNDAGHSQMHAAVSAAGCVFYQDLETQGYKSSTDTGVHCCFSAQNQPSCSSLSSVLPDAPLIQQQPERSLQKYFSVRSMWQRDEMSHQSTPLSRSQECVHPDPPPTRSVIPSGYFSAGQKLHYPAFQELSSQDDQHILEFLPLNNETQSMHPLCLPCMDDLRLPRCLSPLEPCTSSTMDHQPVLNKPTNLSVKIKQEPSQHGRPWLTENPGSLQFPLRGTSHRKKEDKSASVPQDTNRRWSKLNPQNEGTWTKSRTAKERENVSAGQLNAAEIKSDPRKVKVGGTTGDTIAPKSRKARNIRHPQEAAGSLLAYKGVKVSDGTKRQINFSISQVSLPSNNVLVKEREMASSSLNTASKFVGKPSIFTESLSQKSRESGVNTDLTRIRTRGFLKKAQKELSDTSPETPMTHIVRTVNKQGVTSRKHGRPLKTLPQELSPPKNNPAVEETNRNEESLQKMDNSLLKDLQNREKAQRRCIKRRMNSTDLGVIPLKKAVSTERNKNDADTEIIPDMRKPGTPRRPQVVTLKEFQNLIKRQHSKMSKSKESQEANKAVEEEENEGMSNRDSTSEESTEEVKMDLDVTQRQDGDGWSDESQVTVDKSHNKIFNESNKSQRDDTNNSTCGVLEEEVAKLAAEGEQPLKSPDGGTTRAAAESCTAQQTIVNDEDSSQGDVHLPQEMKPPSNHNSHPGTHLPDVGGVSRTLGCDVEEEEEEEEEEEVDVLLYSPVKVPRTTESQDGHNNTEVTPDEEEEEEDMNEIDVTGDEAE